MRIEFGKERIVNPQIGIMHSQVFFEDLTAVASRFKESASVLALAVVLSQIGKRLLAFKDRCRPKLFRQRSISCDVGTISASGQTQFHRASRVAMRLRPEESETFEPGVPRGFASGVGHSRTHFASSRAQ